MLSVISRWTGKRCWLRKRNRVSVGETAGEILLELLGAVFELVLEAVFDG